MDEGTIHLIINPLSGHGGHKSALPELRRELRRYGFKVVDYVTQSSGDATRRAREVALDADAVIAFGGDGTANEVANGLAGTTTPLLVAPAGTENLLAKELRMPTRPVDLVAVLRRGKVLPCDIGLINGQSFHSILGVGFDAEVVRRVTANRTGHISHLSYFWPIWRTFWEHKFPILHITADGQNIFDGPGLAFVGNISRYATGLRVCCDAKFDDGLLDLVVFECSEKTTLMLHAAWTLLRRHPQKGNVVYKQARKITIDADKPIHCEMDGDLGPTTPLNISINPHKIHLIIPPRHSRWTVPMWPWKGEAPL